MLKIEYSLAKIVLDAADNEPLKIWVSLTYAIRNLNLSISGLRTLGWLPWTFFLDSKTFWLPWNSLSPLGQFPRATEELPLSLSTAINWFLNSRLQLAVPTGSTSDLWACSEAGEFWRLLRQEFIWRGPLIENARHFPAGCAAGFSRYLIKFKTRLLIN